jgi:hypothetical protein
MPKKQKTTTNKTAKPKLKVAESNTKLVAIASKGLKDKYFVLTSDKLYKMYELSVERRGTLKIRPLLSKFDENTVNYCITVVCE